MSVKELNGRDFEAEVINKEGIALVDFYASWCGPCRLLAPVIEEIAEERPDITVAKVNVEEEPALAARFDIMSIPCVIVFENGIKLAESVGLKKKSELLTLLPTV